jgi:hypothetical protein
MAEGKTVKVCTAMFLAVLIQAGVPVLARAGSGDAVCVESPLTNASKPGPRITVTGGINQTTTWLVADIEELRIRKFTNKGGGSTIELSRLGDVVVIGVDKGLIRVARNGQTVTVDSPESLESVQQLLAGSQAMFHTRAFLSALEARSTFKGIEISLLSTAAFAASLTGDTGAPMRIAERFVEKHRGIFRRVRFDDGSSCWTSYENEVTAAWGDLQGCMAEADSSGMVMGAVLRLACNGVWLFRGESAWFEYIKCLSPLTGFPKLE